MLTIADRIRYYRKQRGLTQTELAELAGVHPVSIRKYETNKMRPQAAQMERVAHALQVNCSAIRGVRSEIVHLDTEGNLMGLLMEWHKSGIMRIEGERDENQTLIPSSVRFVPNPILVKYLIPYGQNEKETDSRTDSLKGMLPDKMFSELLRWECLYNQYQLTLKKEEIAEDDSGYMDELEQVEMEIQSSIEYM